MNLVIYKINIPLKAKTHLLFILLEMTILTPIVSLYQSYIYYNIEDITVCFLK